MGTRGDGTTAFNSTIRLERTREGDIVDVTEKVRAEIARSGIRTGICLVFVAGATGAMSVIEYEPGLIEDFPEALERLVPKGHTYQHHLRWHDGNGHSHVRATLLKPDISVPVIDGEPKLGTWQQIIFLELDVKERERELYVQVVGE